MKKFIIFMMVLLVTFSVSGKRVNASEYFTNNKELDGIFKELEKEFSKYKKDEVIPKERYEIIITEEDRKNAKPAPKKKITDKQMKEALQRVINDFKVDIEIKEEEIGGFTSQDYKLIIKKFEHMIQISKDSSYGWDTEGKVVSLYVSGAYETYDTWQFYNDLKGKFKEQGKEKDQPGKITLQVKSLITKYLNQAKQRGNKINTEVFSELPSAVEKIFSERELSPIVVARSLSDIHKSLYVSEEYDYIGDQSLDSILEEIESSIEWCVMNRESEKTFDYFEFPKDLPSEEFREEITKKILSKDISESFSYGFRNSITLKDLAKLYFENIELDEKIVIENNIIKSNSPDYIKTAFIFGMIDNQSDLDKPLTRVEATRRLVNGGVYKVGYINNILPITDNAKISLTDQTTVSSCIYAGMKTRIDKFAPTSGYTKEEAIHDKVVFKFENLRGYNIPFDLSAPREIILGKNTIHLIFKNNSEIKEYMEDNFDDTVFSKIKLTGKYTKVDTGGLLIELYTANKGIKFTIKNGVKYLNLERGKYGPELQYELEPRVVKTNEKINMNLQPDSVYKKLNTKIDGILKKIIKPSMSDEQKVKAIHDFVVKHITYDGNLRDEQTTESIIKTIDIGRGVCGDYTLLFLSLCERASIPCIYESGDPNILNHAWNSVFINGKWLFVDTTWDDGENGKLKYTYFLKDKYTFMKTHTPYMGVPDEDVYTNIDSLNIKNQDELRGYLLQNIIWVDGYKLTFRMADKKMKPIINYMRDPYVTVSLKYDSKKNLYTIHVKKR